VQQQSELLLQAGPIAASTAKALVRRIAKTGEATTIDADNAALIAALRVSPEGQEGLAAFLGKRRPSWTET
jgi:methylglutaconyl-CoA hydratase